MGDLEHALSAYENALRHNPISLPGLTQVAGIARIKENYPKVKFPIFSSLPLPNHFLTDDPLPRTNGPPFIYLVLLVFISDPFPYLRSSAHDVYYLPL